MAIVTFCVVIPITPPLPLAVLLYGCSRAWSIGTALDARGNCWTQKSPSMNIWYNIGNFYSSFVKIQWCPGSKWKEQKYCPLNHWQMKWPVLVSKWVCQVTQNRDNTINKNTPILEWLRFLWLSCKFNKLSFEFFSQVYTLIPFTHNNIII